MSKIKSVAYCRVSTDSKEQANSFENQKEHFTEYISKSEDMELIDIYADQGITGTSLSKRPEFNRMLRDAGLDVVTVRGNKYVLVDSGREPLFNLILVSNTSRFARNILVVDILRELQSKGVYVSFMDISKSTANPDDWVFIQFFLNFDEMDSRDKSKKISEGHQRSAKRGRMHTNSKLYGYSYDTETKQLTIIPEEAEVVCLIFSEYAKGIGMRRVINALDAKGYKTRAGKGFSQSTISHMLRNHKYKGTLVRNKWTTGRIFVDEHYPKHRPEDEWYKFPDDDRVPAIVDADLWDKCQVIRASKKNTRNQKGIYKGKSEYAGKIFCCVCGSTYSKNKSRGVGFYNCSLKKAKGVAACQSRNVSVKFIKEQEDLLVESYGRNVKQLTGAYSGQLEVIKRVLFSRLDESRASQIATLKKQKAQATERFEQLLTIMTDASASISADTIPKTLAELDKQIATIDNKISELSKDNAEIMVNISEIDAIQAELKKMRTEKPTRKQILGQVKKMTVVYTETADELRIDFTLKVEERIRNIANAKKYLESESHQAAIKKVFDIVS